MVVEEDKAPQDRGRYLNPSAFGEPEEKRIGRTVPSHELAHGGVE